MEFDAVMVCTGHHAEKHIPEFPGLSNFKGKVLHSHDYRHPAGYENKRVVIIGIGNSGGDMAVELSRVASQVGIVILRGGSRKKIQMHMQSKFTRSNSDGSNIINIFINYLGLKLK